MKYSIRERYLWQLLFPDPNDPLYPSSRNQFRAELHDRLIAPIYPIAFAVIAFAYLGAPRTNRQSRTVSMLGGGRRRWRCCGLTGFVSTVFGATIPWMLSLQYVALAIAFGGGLYVIRSGLILEPPRIHRQLAQRAHRAHVAPRRHVMSRHADDRTEHSDGISACAFLGAVLLVFVGIFALVALVDYIETDAPRQRHPERLGAPGGEGLVLPRAADCRANYAVLRADRHDGLLSQSVAAAGIGGRPFGRRVGLAIHRAGGRRGLPARRRCDHRLQSALGDHAGTVEALTKPSCSATGRALLHERRPVLDQPAQQRRPGHHQRQGEPRPGRQPQRRDDLRLRQ